MTDRTRWAASFSEITRRDFLVGTAASIAWLNMRSAGATAGEDQEDQGKLESAFMVPPMTSRPWVYWWWLEGVATKAGITRDLEEMKRQGISGVLVFDSGSGGPRAPKGAKFMGEEWRDNFRHAAREAARLDMEMGVSLCSGWDAGGEWVEREDAVKTLVWTESTIDGPTVVTRDAGPEWSTLLSFEGPVVQKVRQDWYRDIALLAYRVDGGGLWKSQEMINIEPKKVDGRLSWNVPPGKWTLLRFGYILSDNQIKNTSYESAGWEIDPLSAEALDHHFKNTAAKLIEDAGPLAGQTFKYTHIDSWEIGQPSWTPRFTEEFQSRRGYNPVSYLPALAGKTVDSPEITERFKWDYRRTIADLVVENYYGRLTTLSHEKGLGTHSESGGPFFHQYIDGLECEGADDIPMAEFWSTRPYRGDEPQGVSDPFFQSQSLGFPACNTGSVRQAASASRIYGRAFCQAEAYTGFNQDWTEDPYFLKADGDRAFCLGLGRIVIHHYALVPDFDAKPGNQWEHVSIHFNRNITWWDKAHGWLTYLGRCQHLLRQGVFVADMLYFSGETIPNFVLIDRKPIAGYDFDTLNAQALLTRAEVKNKKIVLEGGLSYRYLILPGDAAQEMTPRVIARLREMVQGGMTLIGSRPQRAPGLTNYPKSDEDVRKLAAELWGPDGVPSGMREVGQGRVFWGKSPEEVVKLDRLEPDLELRGLPPDADFDWIHRRLDFADIYFLANGTDRQVELESVFRVSGKPPELWDPVTGERRRLTDFKEESGRIVVPMTLAPRQSFFVLFREGQKSTSAALSRKTAFPKLKEIANLRGPWQVSFDPTWGGPGRVVFERLQDWTKHSEDGIRHYSGTAAYTMTFDLPLSKRTPLYLDLGIVKNVAQVYLNGEDLGVVWAAPWRVNIPESAKAAGNELKIEVVNLWPNRLIKDAVLPIDQRLTKTNVRTYDPVLPADLEVFGNPTDEDRRRTGRPPQLLPSGLLGPVTVQSEV